MIGVMFEGKCTRVKSIYGEIENFKVIVAVH